MKSTNGKMIEFGQDPAVNKDTGSSSWIEDTCTLCCSKCYTLRRIGDGGEQPKLSGQFPTEDLLTLLDAVLEEPPESVTLCGSCSVMIGKLQGIHENLMRIQSSFAELQREIASRITMDAKPEDDVRTSLCKRWRMALTNVPSTDSNDSETFECLVDIKSKIPKDLIISPAMDEAVDEDAKEDKEFNGENHEVQFTLDPSEFEVVTASDSKYQILEGNDSSNNTNVECIDVDDSDDEETEVDAASLIPAIEISGFADSDQIEFQQQDSMDSQPSIYYSNGTIFTDNIDSLYPDTSLQLGIGSIYEEAPDQTEQNPRRVRRVRSAPGKQKCPVFSCTVCTETFRTREKFKEHLEIHNGKAPTCAVCQKVFPRKHNLIIHMRTHTGEKPYDCPVCHKPYSDRSNFNAHVRKHMAKPYGCTVCARMFDTCQAAHAHATSVHPDEAAGKIISKVTFKNN